MPYSINHMIVDSAQNVVALDWSYYNLSGTIQSRHKLLDPYGKTQVAEVTEKMATQWLEDQLQNTSAEFDAEIDKRKAASDYEGSCVDYIKDGSGHYAPAPTPTPTPTPAIDLNPA